MNDRAYQLLPANLPGLDLRPHTQSITINTPVDLSEPMGIAGMVCHVLTSYINLYQPNHFDPNQADHNESLFMAAMKYGCVKAKHIKLGDLPCLTGWISLRSRAAR